MEGESHMSDDSTAPDMTDAKTDKQERGQSSLQFLYLDLGDALEVATNIFGVSGGGTCQPDQLAAKMGQSPTSSGFRLRLTTAGMFGLIESDRPAGGVKLTDLGQMVMDSTQAKQAKVTAFLSIELYKVLYDNYRGKVLPPASALEREMVSRGVAAKQTARARQVFERSADTAGFFEFGRDRLVMPGGLTGETTPKDVVEKPRDGGGNGGGGGNIGLNLDPLLIELLKKIPPTADGWVAAKRVRWFKTFAMNVSEIYDAEGEPVELKIEVEGAGK